MAFKLQLKQQVILVSAVSVLMTAALGVGGLYTSSRQADLARDIYDKAFMGVNYARKSQIDWQHYVTLAATAGSSEDEKKDLLTKLYTELGVAAERSITEKAKTASLDLQEKIKPLAENAAALDAEQIDTITRALDKVAQRYMNDGSNYRDQVDDIVAHAKWLLGVVDGVALAVAFFIGWLLRKGARQQELQTLENQRYTQNMEALISRFEASTTILVSSAEQAGDALEQSAHLMAEDAADTAMQAAHVATNARQANTNLHMVAAAAEEMTSAGNEIQSLVMRALDISRASTQLMREADDTVAVLSESSQNVAGVVGVINELAGQTNLLALNATIEAARAGDAGKGFTVVAAEVKNLADQTTESTGKIDKQIQDMQNSAGQTIDALQQVKHQINENQEIAEAVARAITEQADTTAEITRNVQQIADGSGQVTESIEIVNETAAKSGNNSRKMLADVQDLHVQLRKLQENIAVFLGGIREL